MHVLEQYDRLAALHFRVGFGQQSQDLQNNPSNPFDKQMVNW